LLVIGHGTRLGSALQVAHFGRADALLTAAEGRPLYAYIVVALLTGARTEELRTLTRAHVDLDATPPVIMVWRSVRVGGDTKTRRSRRTLELPQRCVDARSVHRGRQDQLREQTDENWHDNDLVFASVSALGHTGTTTTETVYRKQIRPEAMGARLSWTACSRRGIPSAWLLS
jgi:integrase